MHYWYMPAKWMILDRWNSMDHIGQIGAPLLVIHGARDRTVPARYGRRLFEAALDPKEMLVLDRADHNDLYDFPQVSADHRFFAAARPRRRLISPARDGFECSVSNLQTILWPNFLGFHAGMVLS